MDLRERVVATVDAGMTQPEAAARFEVSLWTVERHLSRRRASGSLAATEQRHGPEPMRRQLHAWLPDRLAAAAYAMLEEHVTLFVVAGGERVSPASMSQAIASLLAEDPGQALTARGRRRRPGRPLKYRP
jgi:hypothetical protein